MSDLFIRSTRTRAEAKVDEFIDDGETITIPNASIVIKNRKVFYDFKRTYKNPGTVLEILLGVGISFTNYVMQSEGLSLDQILERILKEDSE